MIVYICIDTLHDYINLYHLHNYFCDQSIIIAFILFIIPCDIYYGVVRFIPTRKFRFYTLDVGIPM